MVSLRYFKLFLQYKEENSLRLHAVPGRKKGILRDFDVFCKTRMNSLRYFKLFRNEDMKSLGRQALPARQGCIL